MKAIILCAGYGKRLHPLTQTHQKTMLPLHGKPLLEYITDGLIYTGFKDIILVVGFKKEQIIDYFQNGKKWGINIEYVIQEDLNGTGGAVLLCENLIKNQHFFLTWGDILVPYQVYKKVLEIYQKENQDYILVANYAKDPHKGAAIYYDDHYCTKIVEKPPKGTSKSNYNDCGIFILSTEVFKILRMIKPSNRGEIELPQAINAGILERNWKVWILKLNKNQFRGDFGDIDEYEKFKKDLSWLKLLKS
ncbi:MAG: nucleotidyltransferase family protein [Candidatus Hodarchaeota archaeon]